MISPAQWRVLRALVIDALTVDVPAGVQTIPAARVVIVKSGRDHPAPALPWCTLSILGTEEQGLDGERLHTTNGDDELVETVRTEWHTTITVQLAVRMRDDDPELADDAWILGRRVATRLRRSAARDALIAVGTGILRLSNVRDLSRYTGSQAESRVALDLVMPHAVLDETQPGWISTVAGEGTLVVDDDTTLAVPFEGDDTE